MDKRYLLCLLLIFSGFSFAENKCVSGSPESTRLNDQLKSAQKGFGITRHLCEKYSLMPSTEAVSVEGCAQCAEEAKGKSGKNADALRAIASPSSQLIFKQECLDVAGSIQAHADEIQCPEGKSGHFNYCISSDLLKYENAVISDFLSCVKKVRPDFPMTAQGLFETYSLESGFKPHYASTDGVGIGQLVSIFVKDIGQAHRGQRIMKSIEESQDPACMAARALAVKDLKNPPLMPRSNRCAFTQIGEGMERNVLYSLVGMANAWELDILPVMKKFNERCEKDPKFSTDEKFRSDYNRAQQLALINSYGSGGRAAARAAVRRLSRLGPEAFVKAIKRPLHVEEDGESLTRYITTMQAKQRQLASKFNEPLKSEFQKMGAKACMQ